MSYNSNFFPLQATSSSSILETLNKYKLYIAVLVVFLE